MRLLLVRHGESICGVNGIVGGQRGCTGLTERGFEQARALRDRLAAEGFRADALFASTLPRAYQTADVLAEALPLDVTRDPQLCEFVPGEIDGTPWADFEGFDVVAEPDRVVSAGGESLSRFRQRVRRLFERLTQEHDGRTVVAVCHGGVISQSIVSFFGTADRRRVHVDVDFTSVTEYRWEDPLWRLRRFNDVAHLVGRDLLPLA